MTDAERAQIAVMARLLEAAGRLDTLSTGLTLLALAACAFGKLHATATIVIVVLGLIAKLYDVRIAFDAKLFRDLSTGALTTADLDHALVALALAPSKKTGRDWTMRCRGAKRLIVICAAATIGQCITICLLAGLTAPGR